MTFVCASLCASMFRVYCRMTREKTRSTFTSRGTELDLAIDPGEHMSISLSATIAISDRRGRFLMQNDVNLISTSVLPAEICAVIPKRVLELGWESDKSSTETVCDLADSNRLIVREIVACAIQHALSKSAISSLCRVCYSL